MDGAKIFFSHMVKARIFFFAKTRARIFFSKKTQAPPCESNGRSLITQAGLKCVMFVEEEYKLCVTSVKHETVHNLNIF